MFERFSQTSHSAPSSPIVTALVTLPVLAAAIYLSLAVFDHSTKDIYGIPTWGVTATVLLVVLMLVGAGLIVWSRQAGLSAVVLAGAALTTFGVLAIFSVGLLALMAAAGLLLWASAPRWSNRRRTPATVGAVLAGAPLPLLAVFALAGPLVDCEAEGASSGENIFMGLGSMGGSGASWVNSSVSSTPDGINSGRLEGAGYAYSFECRNGKLVRFNLRWR